VTGAISFAAGRHIPDKEVTIMKVHAGELTRAAVLRPQRVPAP
jgi:hypothetical protein